MSESKFPPTAVKHEGLGNGGRGDGGEGGGKKLSGGLSAGFPSYGGIIILNVRAAVGAGNPVNGSEPHTNAMTDQKKNDKERQKEKQNYLFEKKNCSSL